MFRSNARAALLIGFSLVAATAGDVRIVNPTGRVDVRAVMGAPAVQFHATSASREVLPQDVWFQTVGDQTLIVSQPRDRVKIDLAVTVPHSTHATVETTWGDISLTGIVNSARLKTETGSVSISTTWALSHLRVLSDAPPGDLRLPNLPGIEFQSGRLDGRWALGDWRHGTVDVFRRPWRREDAFTIHVDAGRPARLELTDIPLPPDSWIRDPSEAPSLLQNFRELVRSGRRGASETRSPEMPAPGQQADGVHFRSDVRLVTLAVSIYDRDGHPAAGLTRDDFELTENNAPQEIAFASAGETPFNMVLLLDLSASTLVTHPLVQQAARDFVQIAQPRDRVAIHAISSALFQLVSPLTNDRARLLSMIESMPAVTGGTPLYDCIVLSTVEQPIARPGEQLALVVLTDGMDNQIAPPGPGSTIRFRALRDMAAEWPAPIYTLLVPYADPKLQKRGHENMRQLSERSGGRLFKVSSLDDLAPAYARVAAELRSIYTIGYYPKDQNFDGRWRTIRLRAKRSGLTLRTRPGYRAW